MISVLNTILLIALAWTLNISLPWLRNIRTAKASGIPYIVVPYYSYNVITGMFMARTFLGLVDKIAPDLPAKSWRHLVTGGWPWKWQYKPFAELGTDTFLTVSPGGFIMSTADADVIAEIIDRPTDFPKASRLYRNVSIYGENVVAAEGATWKHHRKLTSPLFTEKNNQLVWKQTIEGSQALCETWLGQPRTIRTVAQDTMRLSLAIIGRAGLGHEVEWPSASAQNDTAGQEALPDGHTMTFTGALTSLLQRIFVVILLPKWFLKKAPFAFAKKAYRSYDEWGQYMKESIATKRAMIKEGTNDSTMRDLLGQLVKEQDSTSPSKTGAGSGLSESEIMGNLFVMIIAGHETSANSIHFSLLLLALHPQTQKAVQEELDAIFQNRSDPSQWDYERDLPNLLKSKLAMVLNEELRLFAPTISIPKITGTSPQRITINGKQALIPANTIIRLCVPAVHRNPRFWPHDPIEDQLGIDAATDLENFRPERWQHQQNPTSTNADSDTNPLFTPHKGSYIPFSDGARACLGKRFAQVEVLTCLAMILTQCDIEIAVDEWAEDEEVANMTTRERKYVWKKAAEKATWTMQNKMVSIITLQLRGAHVPVRVVRRGEGRFGDL